MNKESIYQLLDEIRSKSSELPESHVLIARIGAKHVAVITKATKMNKVAIYVRPYYDGKRHKSSGYYLIPENYDNIIKLVKGYKSLNEMSVEDSVRSTLMEVKTEGAFASFDRTNFEGLGKIKKSNKEFPISAVEYPFDYLHPATQAWINNNLSDWTITGPSHKGLDQMDLNSPSQLCIFMKGSKNLLSIVPTSNFMEGGTDWDKFYSNHERFVAIKFKYIPKNFDLSKVKIFPIKKSEI